MQERLHAIKNDIDHGRRHKLQPKLWSVWSDMNRSVYERRKYVLRVLQHIRGHAPASWQSLPSTLRVTILEFVVPDICTPLGQTESFAEEYQLPEAASTTLGLLPTELKHYRSVRRQFDSLHFVSKQFSADVSRAMYRKIENAGSELNPGPIDESRGERLLQLNLLGLREHRSEQDIGHRGDAYPASSEEDVVFEWIWAFDRLACYLDDFDRSLTKYGCYGLDEDEAVDWSSQMWWLKRRTTRCRSQSSSGGL